MAPLQQKRNAYKIAKHQFANFLRGAKRKLREAFRHFWKVLISQKFFNKHYITVDICFILLYAVYHKGGQRHADHFEQRVHGAHL